MKIGPNGIVGTPEEIKDYQANNGLKFDDFFRRILPARWVIIPCLLYAASALSIPLFKSSYLPFLFLFLFGIGFMGWSVVSLQLRYNNRLATSLLTIIMIAILSAASGFLSPSAVLKYLRTALNSLE